MATLWTFILIGAVIGLFWFTRQIAEHANQHAQRQCQQLGVQFVSVACKKWRFGILRRGNIGVKSEFLFEFSSDGERLYQATLLMENTKLKQAIIPPHTI